jgi:ABC-type lipoprotein export system ATPase subunit
MSCAPLELRAVTCLREAAAITEVTEAFPPGTCTLVTGGNDSRRDLLLRLAGLVEAPDTGDVLLAGKGTRRCSDEERAELRSQQVGFVFRAPFLLPAFSVVENVALPLFRRSHVDATEAGARTGELLRFVGVMEAAEERVEKLSLAAQHRASLARALVNRPAVLLVEELDADLEENELRAFRALLRQACTRFGVAVIASSRAARWSDEETRVLDLSSGAGQRSTLLS